MRKLRLIFLSVIILVGIEACHENSLSPTSGTDTTDSTTVSHTSVVYIVADNSLNAYAQLDLDEILDGFPDVGDTASNHLLVYLDDSSSPMLMNVVLENDTTAIFDTIQVYSEHNSLNPDTMAAMINQATGLFPADSYGLTLWSHGSGWLPGTDQSSDTKTSTRSFGVDDYSSSTTGFVEEDSGTQMDILDLQTALENCEHFKYILFDACDMQDIEVAYQLKDVADYFIGSPGEIPGYGAPYETVVPAFFEEDNTAEEIAEAYYEPYAEAYNYNTSSNNGFGGRNSGVKYFGRFTGGSSVATRTNLNTSYTYGVSISVIDASQLENLASATNSILTTYLEDSTTVNTEDVLSYDDNYYNFFYDLDGFIKSVTDSLADDDTYNTWKEAYDEAVPYFYTTSYVYSSYANDGNGGMSSMSDATGVSTFIPANANFLDASYWAYYVAIGEQYPQYSYLIDLMDEEEEYYQNYYKDFDWDNAAGWSSLGW